MTAPRLVVSRAPLRVSFCGGGSDLPPPAGTRGQCGAVVSSSLDLAVYCIAKPRTDSAFYLSWREKEIVEHPGDFKHEIVRNAFADLARDGAEFPGGVELSFLADVPGTGSGLGSSAATAAACLLALDALAEHYDGIHGRRDLAERSISIQPGASPEYERLPNGNLRLVKKPMVGKQDEYASVYGGLNAMRFNYDVVRVQTEHTYFDSGTPFMSVDLSPIGEEDPAAAGWLQERFALFRPPDGAARSAAEVLATYRPERDAEFRSDCLHVTNEFMKAVRERDTARAIWAVARHGYMKGEAFGGHRPADFECKAGSIKDAGDGNVCVKLCGAGGTGHLLVGFEPGRRAEVVAAAEKAWGKELKFRFGTEGAAVVYRECEGNKPEKIGRT